MKTLLQVLMALGVCIASNARGEVIISEILYEAQGTDRDLKAKRPYDRQWVELYNAGDAAIDLAGWQLGNVRAAEWTAPFPAGTRLEPKQAIVITGDAATFDDAWGRQINRLEVAAFPDWPSESNNANKVVALRDAAGALRDSIDYGAAGWPRPFGSDGHSVYALPAGLTADANDDGANWRAASQGVYGARFTQSYGASENHGSPGVVIADPQPPFAPSADVAWSMVILPDTQNYSRDTSDFPILLGQIDWIKKNKDAFKIQAVLQEGDIVNQNGGDKPIAGDYAGAEQWANARRAFGGLNGVLPYIMATGNHDYGTTNSQTRETKFNDFFKATDNPLVDPAHGGVLKGTMTPGRLENAFYEFTAPDGREMLIIALEFWPRQAAIDWANTVAHRPRFKNHTAVLLTHWYLNSNGERSETKPDAFGMGPDGNGGAALWNKLVRKHANFAMTFNGHVGGDGVAYRKSTGDRGNTVHQMLINSQFEARGGNGWLRVLEFLDDGQTVRVRTYSPFLGVYRTDPENLFEFTLRPVGALAETHAASGVDEATPPKTKRSRKATRARQASLRSK